MNHLVLPRSPHTKPTGRPQLTSCPPLAILRPRGQGTPSQQRLSYRSCYALHRAAAQALDASTLRPFDGDARTVLANVRVGLDNALADRSSVEQHLPRIPLPLLLSLADVARALVFASTQGLHDERDRLWTLLTQRHAFLRKVGWYFHGERCDAMVPPLDAPATRALDDEDEHADGGE